VLAGTANSSNVIGQMKTDNRMPSMLWCPAAQRANGSQTLQRGKCVWLCVTEFLRITTGQATTVLSGIAWSEATRDPPRDRLNGDLSIHSRETCVNRLRIVGAAERAYGAFFQQDAVPFHHWLDLQQFIRRSPTWTRVTAEVSGFGVPALTNPWGRPLWVAIYRRKVMHRTAKNFQLDLFDPDDGSYEYSAITSNLEYTLTNLWHFMAGRGAHEKTIAQLKSGLAFHTVPTLAYTANSAWQRLVALTHNLLTNFQIDTGAEPRRRSRKHTAILRLATVQTLCFTLFHRAALLLRPAGRSTLRLAKNPAMEDLFMRIDRELSCAA
jgi:hypothetical protein